MYIVKGKGSRIVSAVGTDGEIGTFPEVDFGGELIRLTFEDGTKRYYTANTFDMMIEADISIDKAPSNEEIQQGKWCYTEEKQFYPNPDWREPPKPLEEVAKENSAKADYLASMLDVEM